MTARPIHFQTGSSKVRCGAPMRDAQHPEGWDLGNVTVVWLGVTCPACRPGTTEAQKQAERRTALDARLTERRGAIR